MKFLGLDIFFVDQCYHRDITMNVLERGNLQLTRQEYSLPPQEIRETRK